MRDSAWAEFPNDVASFLRNVFLVHSITHFVMILGCLSAPCDKSSWSKYLLHRDRGQEEERQNSTLYLSFFLFFKRNFEDSERECRMLSSYLQVFPGIYLLTYF